MALSRLGNRLGRAAQIDAREQRDYLLTQQKIEIKRKQDDQETALIHQCREIEGDASFWAWYQSDEVPDFGSCLKRIEMIQARISRLKDGELKTLEERSDTIEENLLLVERTMSGPAYFVARDELLSELVELGDRLQIYLPLGAE